MTFVFDADAPVGRQYQATFGRTHVVAAIMSEGLGELDATKLLHEAHMQARATRQSSPIRVPRAKNKRVELDSEVLTNFIRDRCVDQRGGSMLFSEFFSEFVAWMEPSLRDLWTRIRVSKALPPEYPSVAGRGNIRFVSGLVRRPA